MPVTILYAHLFIKYGNIYVIDSSRDAYEALALGR